MTVANQLKSVVELNVAFIEAWDNIDATVFQELINGMTLYISQVIYKYDKYLG